VLCNQIVGLYAGEKIRKDRLIMEYTGKIIDENLPKEATNLLVNDFKGRSYCFTQDRINTIDAIYVGNLMRFANHACESLSNC